MSIMMAQQEHFHRLRCTLEGTCCFIEWLFGERIERHTELSEVDPRTPSRFLAYAYYTSNNPLGSETTESLCYLAWYDCQREFSQELNRLGTPMSRADS